MTLGRRTTTDDLVGDRDLTDLTALVTGSSAGLGVETVRALADRGATVLATARDTAKARRALGDAGVDLDGSVTVEACDLASLASVRDCTDRILGSTDRLGLLVANAGVMACPEGRTADGFETQFGTNHLGHFVLVNRLVPLLIAGAPSRVVTVSSAGHRLGDVDLDDPNFDGGGYVPFVAYGRSKTANILFAVELDRRLRHLGVRAAAVHPGGIDTELGRHLDDATKAFIEARRQENPGLGKTVAEGAATSLWAGVAADAGEVGGRYAEDCAVSPVIDGDPDPAGPSGVRSYALDPDRAAALWARSESLVGERFNWEEPR
jgi:NAD(P)-dependent dehydrogenase (short-subunit alcohol dehydrogenase family)